MSESYNSFSRRNSVISDGTTSSFQPSFHSFEKSSFNEAIDDDQDIILFPFNESSLISNGTIESSYQLSLEESTKPWYDLNQDINDLDDDQDVVSFDESQKRLNCLCIILALPCIILTSALVSISYQVFQPPQMIFYNNSVQNSEAKIPHVMILSSDGYMTPYTWKSNPKTRGNFPKLPNSKVYGMVSYADNLYAFSLSKFTGMTMIRPNGTNRFIQSHKEELFQKHGKVVLVNKFIWTLGLKKGSEDFDDEWHHNLHNIDYFQENLISYETYRFSFRRQNKNWSDGPRIPSNFDTLHGCMVTFNRTFVIVIGQQTNQIYHGEGNVYGYDFHSSKWISLEQIPLPCLCVYLENGDFIGYHFHISCAIQHQKHSRLVFRNTFSNQYGQNDPFGLYSKILAMTTIDKDIRAESEIYEEMTLWEFDLKSNIWNKVVVQGLHHKGELVVLQGIIHYFLHPNHEKNTLGFFFNETTMQFQGLREPGVFVNGSSTPAIIPALCSLTV